MLSATNPVSRINGLPLHIPPSLQGVAPVSPNDADFAYEVHSWLGLCAVLEPHSVIYDCGAAHGLMSAMIATVVKQGEIHAFEANPDVLPLTREVLEKNHAQVVLNAVCVGERSGFEVEFYRAPGLSCVASSRHAVVASVHPQAMVARVPVVALDDYAAARGHWPDVIKIDIEGSEYVALQGASRILGRRPHLLIETHPAQMIGEGASLEALCSWLEAMGYPLFDLQGGALMGGRDFAAAYGWLPGYLMASVRLREDGFVERLAGRHREMKDRYASRERHQAAMQQARTMLEGEPLQAVPLLEEVLRQTPAHAEAHYLLAFALQSARQDAGSARNHYLAALAHGFDAFWVHYNLGALLLETGDRRAAGEHLHKAKALNPAHEGVAFYLRQLA
jgi:FkbM family methyltransferase